MSAPSFIETLRNAFGDCVCTDAVSLRTASSDWSGRYGSCSAVVRARCEADVVTLLRLAQEMRFAVVPRGAGTSATGAVLPSGHAVVLDLSAMNRILDIDTRDMVAEVEPGVLTQRLQQAVEEHNLLYPPDPASSDICTLGGNVATCAGGLRAVKYGVTRDYVLGLRCVLLGGEVFETGGRNLKDVSGYDLTRLLVGSEGTLAVVTRITLKLVPLPPARSTMLASFLTDDGAFQAADLLLANGVWPRALESMDAQALRLAAAAVGEDVEEAVRSRLLVELDGEAHAVHEEQTRTMTMLQPFSATLTLANDAGAHARLWRGRRAISSAVLNISPAKRSEDLGVPRGQLAAAVTELRGIGEAHGIGVLVYGHAGDANLHCNFLYDPAQAGAPERLEQCVQLAYAAVLARGGTITGEHGVGLRKREALAASLGPVRSRLMRAIKRVFDPDNLLNPGKVLPEDCA